MFRRRLDVLAGCEFLRGMARVRLQSARMRQVINPVGLMTGDSGLAVLVAGPACADAGSDSLDGTPGSDFESNAPLATTLVRE